MTQSVPWRRVGKVVLAIVVLAGVAGAQEPRVGQPEATGKPAVSSQGYTGFTRPSLDITVASRAEGLVAEVLVEEGQAVKQGQPLLRLDSTAEKIEVELSRLQAESDKQLEAMQLIQKQKESELERARILVTKGSITGVELEQRELDVKVSKLNVEVTRNKMEVAKLQYQHDLARLAQREIKAPADGVVTRVYKNVGEAVERLEKVAQLVQLDPLEIPLNMPVETRGRYAAGQKVRIEISGDGVWREAEIKLVDPVVDFASNTYRIKLRLANPGGKIQAGLRVVADMAGK